MTPCASTHSGPEGIKPRSYGGEKEGKREEGEDVEEEEAMKDEKALPREGGGEE